jgi:hypothetical protein
LIKFALFQALKAIVPGGSAFGKFLGFADGAAFAQNGIQPFARGGIVNQPTLCSLLLRALALWARPVQKGFFLCAVAATAT